ncbi:MAG: LysR family transcriptional regulator [Lewinella sp.]|nr:LysR family transcriptional regulator [Lewinella sp.]
MDLKQFRYFVAIAEEEHFGRAAKRLRIVQPALSRQVKLLEEELGILLFERLPRGVVLTEAGRVFLQEIKDVDRHILRAVGLAKATAQGNYGTLRLSLIESAAWHGMIPNSLRLYRERFPEVQVSLSTMPTAMQLDFLRSQQTDAAIVYNPQNIGDLVSIELAQQHVVLAMPEDCPLIENPEISISDLANYTLIGFQRQGSPKLYDDLIAALSGVAFLPNFISEPINETEMLALVSAGAGLAFANASQQWRKPHGVVFAPVRDLDVRMSLQLVHRREHIAPTLSNFLETLHEYLGHRSKDILERDEL